MAGTTREKVRHLDQWLAALQEKPYEYGFFEALRLMECVHHQDRRFGRGAVPAQEPPLRLGQTPEMTFAPAGLEAFASGPNGTPARLLVRFMGMLGSHGPLPLHLTEYAQDRLRRYKDATFNHFLDMFHHRLLSLFYRAWADAEPTVHFDRPQSDRFSGYIGALAGLGMSSLRHRDAICDWTKLYFGGRLAAQAKNVEGLQAMITGYFQITVRIQEFIGEWVHLPQKQMYRLGMLSEDGQLAKSVVVGSKVWSCQHKFRILLGPMEYSSYLRFLPHQETIWHLFTLVRNYIGDELAFDIQLQLKSEQVPAVRLDGQHHLGWTTWLGPRKKDHDAGDLIFDAHAMVRKYHSQSTGRPT